MSKVSEQSQASLMRPDRQPTDPAALGLDPDASISKASALTSLSFERKDLEEQSRFFGDFGLTEIERSASHRAFAAQKHSAAMIEVTRTGADRLNGLIFALPEAEFAYAKKAASASGFRADSDAITLRAPGNMTLRLIPAAHEVRPPVSAMTSVGRAENHESDQWIAPSCITKLGHVVLQARDPLETVRFYRKWLGLIPTDIQVLASGRPVVVFLRLDLGDEPADHHTLVIAQSYKDGFDHAAFETASIDEVGFGHQYLKEKGWRHSWGVGRHWLGGQFFDYWRDPAGAHFEHYAGSDTYTSQHPSQVTDFSRASLYSWGDDLPSSFTPGPKLSELPGILRDIRKGELQWGVLREMQAAAKAAPRSWLK